MRGAEVLERGEYLRGGVLVMEYLRGWKYLRGLEYFRWGEYLRGLEYSRGGGGKYLRGEWVLETPINLFDLRCLKSKLCFFFTF